MILCQLGLSVGGCRCVLVQFVFCVHVKQCPFLLMLYNMVLNGRVLATTHFFEGPTILAYIYSVSIGLKATPVPVVVSNAVVALWRRMS